jgi:hypothetical protein
MLAKHPFGLRGRGQRLSIHKLGSGAFLIQTHFDGEKMKIYLF